MSGDITLLPVYEFMAFTGASLPLNGCCVVQYSTCLPECATSSPRRRVS